LDDDDKENHYGSSQHGSKATFSSSSRKQPPKGKHTLTKRDKVLSSKSRRSPRQVLAFMAEKNSCDKEKQTAYEWAVAQVVEKGETNVAKVSKGSNGAI
jgi:hypothetical protein